MTITPQAETVHHLETSSASFYVTAEAECCGVDPK